MGKLLQKMRRGIKNSRKKDLDWMEFDEENYETEDYESGEEYYEEDEYYEDEDYELDDEEHYEGGEASWADDEEYYEDDDAWESEEYYGEDKTSWADDEEYNEDAEAYGEDGEEYYEDEEAYETDEEEYYGDEEAYEADDEERYEDEESYEIDDDTYYEDEEVYETDEEEYYEDEESYEADEEEYYGDEEAYEADDEERYEDEESYEIGDDTYYEDEEVYEADEEEYYEDEEAYEADEEEYYEDEEAYKADEEEYYGDEEIYASDDGYYEDDEEDYDDDEYYEIDDEDDDYDDDEEAPEGGIGKVVYRITHMSAVDYIITLTSAAVLILAIVTGTMYLGAKSSQAQLETFAEIGVGLEDIDMIGGSGLVAIADAQASKLAAAELEIEQEQEQEEEKKKEQEKAGNIEVVMNLTSIQKDLKIKFINKKTGKLIPNIGFEVEVKTPSGSAVTYKDDDKDGIIYKTDMEPGKYTIKIISPASGSEYQISTEETAITVRDKIEYKKVDVSDEVKTEAQVNAAVEDTKVNETVVESTNTDTVEWVESTKTLIDGTEETEEGYEKIDRSSIADPAQQASAGFRLLTGIEDREPKEGDSQNPPPTAEPAPTEKPEPDPTAAPTEKPADAPPTEAPTEKPTAAPTEVPTEKPTAAPTEAPTEKPTAAPTVVPTVKPTAAPTGKPTAAPTAIPTAAPTGKPTPAPTATAGATASPTVSPTVKPSGSPAPSATPTATPKNLKEDTTSVLKSTSGEVLYVKDGDGHFREAKYADYYNSNIKEFYRKVSTTKGEYRYTGWQEIDGATYFFDKNGNKVTGEQVIQGAKYTFNSDGSLNTGSGHLGIDVSKWNGNIDWNAVKNSGVSYVIIRCGYRGSTTGALIEDPMFRSNIKGASSAGLKVGVYFFTQAVNEVEAVEEASMVLGLIKGYNISYPVFLDVEPSNGRGDKIDAGTRTAVCRAFCQTIQNSGYKSGIYANKTWLNSYVDAPSLASYKIWLAQYAAAPSYNKTKYDMWQYSSKGKVAGISGSVDMNISYMGY